MNEREKRGKMRIDMMVNSEEIHRGDQMCQKREKRKEAHVCVEDGHEIDPRHQQVVAHIVLALHAGGGAEIGADSDIRSTRYIAGSSKWEEADEG